MNTNEMFDRILLESGQFLIKKDKVELNQDKFVTLVRKVLGTYNKYVPVVKKATVSLLGSRQFTFTEANSASLGFPGIPQEITEVIPNRVSGVRPFNLRDERLFGSEYLDIKRPLPYEYCKPLLTVSVSAEFRIEAIFKHRAVETIVNGSSIFEVSTIDDGDDTFFDLLNAGFLKGLGKSRRAFTLEALPLTTDAAEMVSDAEQLEEKAMEDLREKDMKWYLAWGL